MTQTLSRLELWIRYRRNEDRDALVEEYRYLCRRAARRFLRDGVDRCDLEQIGAIGLIKAVDRYDAAQTTPFEAYAWLLVLGELMHHVRDGERLLRAPRRVRELERRCAAAERDLRALLGREPREDDVAGYINATPAQWREIQAYRASGRVASFDALTPSEEPRPLDTFDAVLDKLTLEKFFSTLTPLELQIVRSIHLDGVTVVDLAKRLGYSRRHLTRLHRGALERMQTVRANVASRYGLGH
jgi:RNA polymerase sigma-B factor